MTHEGPHSHIVRTCLLRPSMLGVYAPEGGPGQSLGNQDLTRGSSREVKAPSLIKWRERVGIQSHSLPRTWERDEEGSRLREFLCEL